METTLSFTIPPSEFCSKGAEISFKKDHTQLKEKLSKKELNHFLELYEEANHHPKAVLAGASLHLQPDLDLVLCTL